MTALIPLFAHLSIAAVGSLAASVWEGALLTLVLAACLHFVPRISLGLRSALWLTLYMVLAALPFLSGQPTTSASVETSSPRVHASPIWAFAFAAAWASLSLLRAVQLVRSAFHLRGVAHRAIPIDLREVTQLPGAGEICLSSEVDVPSVAGFFRPRILLPPALLEKLSADDLCQVILHEREHLRRRDDWTNLLQKLALVVFPLNPVLHWVERRLCQERELACDDGVLRATGARKAYAICLTNLAEGSLVRRSLSLALGAWERQSELARRVHRILRQPERTLSRPQAATVCVVVLACMVGGTAELARAPQLISFTQPSHQSVSADLVSSQTPQTFSADSRSEASVRPTLVKATMPAVRRVLPGKRTPRATELSAPRLVGKTTSQTQPRVMLTGWHRQADEQPRLIFAVSEEDFVPAYAAVPTQNGWLIIQL